MPGTVTRWSRIMFASILAAYPGATLAQIQPEPIPLPKPPICIIIPGFCHGHVVDARVDGPISLEVAATPEAPATSIQVQALAWRSAELEPLKSADPQEGGQVYSADPEEGGEVVRSTDPTTTIIQRKAGHGQDEISKSAPVVYSADPQEGGQIVGTADAETAQRSKVRIHEMNVTKLKDVASANLAEPVAKKGTVKVSVLAGSCVKGQHFPEATITMRKGSYHLRDVDVAGCTTNGDNTDTCTLTYASLEG